MRKTFWKVATCMVAVLVTFSMYSCGDDDEGGISGNAEETILGTWRSTHSTGYWLEDGEKETWDEDLETSDIEEYTFQSDGTCLYNPSVISPEYFPHDWKISGNKLTLTYEEYGEEEKEVITLLKLNENELQWEEKDVEEEGGVYYEFYQILTFKRVK